MPSESNIADGRSRLDFSLVRAMGAAEAPLKVATRSLLDWQVLAKALREERALVCCDRIGRCVA